VSDTVNVHLNGIKKEAMSYVGRNSVDKAMYPSYIGSWDQW